MSAGGSAEAASSISRPSCCRVGEYNPAVIEEIFGPALTVVNFDEFEEGVALADHPVYGLAAGVHTSDVNKVLRAARPALLRAPLRFKRCPAGSRRIRGGRLPAVACRCRCSMSRSPVETLRLRP